VTGNKVKYVTVGAPFQEKG